MNRHQNAVQDAPTVDGIYWCQLCPGDPGEALRYSHGAFRAGATVRPVLTWEPYTGQGAQKPWAVYQSAKK